MSSYEITTTLGQNSFDISGLSLFSADLLPLSSQLTVTLDNEVVAFEVDVANNTGNTNLGNPSVIKIVDSALPPSSFGNEEVIIRRTTPVEPLVSFTNGARLPASDLNTAFQQVRYQVEEAVGTAAEAVGTDVPSGGTTDQLLIKTSNVDGATGWKDATTTQWYNNLFNQALTAGAAANTATATITDHINADFTPLRDRVTVVEDKANNDLENRLVSVEAAAANFNSDISDLVSKSETSVQTLSGPLAGGDGELIIDTPLKASAPETLDQASSVGISAGAYGELRIGNGGTQGTAGVVYFDGDTNDGVRTAVPWDSTNLLNRWDSDTFKNTNYGYPDGFHGPYSRDETGGLVVPSRLYPGYFYPDTPTPETDADALPTLLSYGNTDGVGGWMASNNITIDDIGYDSGNIFSQAPLRLLSPRDSGDASFDINLKNAKSLYNGSSSVTFAGDDDYRFTNRTGTKGTILYVPPCEQDLGFLDLTVTMRWGRSISRKSTFAIVLHPDFDEVNGEIGDDAVVVARADLDQGVINGSPISATARYVFKNNDGRGRYFSIAAINGNARFTEDTELYLSWSVERAASGSVTQPADIDNFSSYTSSWSRHWNDPYIAGRLAAQPTDQPSTP